VNTQADRAKEIFLDALEIEPPAARHEFLDRACGGDPALHGEVEDLLAHHPRVGSFLDSAPRLRESVELPAGEGPGTMVGPYKLLEQIGEGGFGVVFMAEQQHPVRRKVALKVLKPGMDTRQVVARFEAERQALALMDHPNIARVFDGGATPGGRPYFVMELVKGVPVTEFCDQNRLTTRERLELFVNVCRAVQHAHQKGIIHRDLKPTNVLVTVHDTTPVVKVIDFGVAKALGQELTDQTLFTGFAQMVGTPLYMSPEQAGQSSLDVDTRSDIYALGVLLYELLTGTTPFDKERFRQAGYEEIRRIIREEEPARPSTRMSTLGQAAATVSANRGSDPGGLSQQLRRELDWIVMKALEKDRNRRYDTASALAADVQRYLNDEAVQACPPSAWYRFRKLARRNRRTLAMVSVLTLAAFVGVGALAVSTALVLRANQDVWKANQELRAAMDRERLEAYYQRITVAHHELSLDNLAAALRALRECPEDLRGWEWYYLMRLCKVEPLVIRARAEVNGVAFSPDGERLASAGGDGAVKVWDSRTGEVIRNLEKAHSGPVYSVAFHPDGKHLASRGADQQVKVSDWTTGREVFTWPCDAVRKFGTAYTVAFSPDGRQLAAGSDGAVWIWDWENRQLLQSLPGHDANSIPVAFSPDGRLAAGTWRQGLKLWDPETGQPLRTIDVHRHPVSALAFSPDGEWLASTCYDRTVKVSNSTTGALRYTFDLHAGNIECVAYSPDGRRLASGGEDKTVRIWDLTTGHEVLGLRGHTGRCGCVAFSPDGRLASASTDGTIRLWDATPLQGNEGQEILTFTQHSDGDPQAVFDGRCVAFSPDGQQIASAGHAGLVKVWNAQTGAVTAEFGGHRDLTGHRVAIFCVAWHPKGHRIASAGVDAVRVWDTRTEREAFKLPTEQGKNALAYDAVAFSPDGRYLVAGNQAGAVQVWDAGTGQEVRTLDLHSVEIRGVVFSRDGKHLASASGDGKVKLWDATRLGERQEPRIILQARVPGPSLNVAFSSDGRRLATGSEENTVKIWDVQTGRELLPLRGHNGEVYTLAFSPDNEGRWVASAGEDSAVKVWDSHTGKLVRTFRGHTGLVSSLAFSPDGRSLVSGSRDETAKVWDVSRLAEVPGR
jgi:WD40 repeat protein/serine/threonine protein kinase